MEPSTQATGHAERGGDTKVPMPRRLFAWLPGHGVSLEEVTRECAEQRRRFTEMLGAAEGEDVIRYLLVLNAIECQGYVAETKIQAHRSFRYLVLFGALGFFTLVGAMAAMMQGAETGVTLPVIAGVLMQVLSGIFMALHISASRRMERFHTSLRGVQETVLALYVRGLLDPEGTGEESRQVISVLLEAGTRPLPDELCPTPEGERRAAGLFALRRSG
jgi:hypothetical protein